MPRAFKQTVVRKRLQFKQSTITLFACAAYLGLAMLLGGGLVYARYATQGEGTALHQQAEFKQLGIDLANASDYLTNEARLYVQTTDPVHLTLYWNEIDVTRTGDNVLTGLKLLGATAPEFDLLATSKNNSDALVGTESRAMRLVLDANGTPEAAMPPAVASYKLSELDKSLSNPDKLLTARRIMFDEQYAQDQSIIMGPVAEFQQMINARAEATARAAIDRTQLALSLLLALVVVAVLGMFAVLWVFNSQLGSPVRRYIDALRRRDDHDSSFALAPAGTYELRELAEAFNQQTWSQQLLLEHNKQLVASLEERTADAEQLVGVMHVQIAERERAEEALQYQAFHDALTGLPNRALFIDRLEHARARAERQHTSVAVLFLDLDNFKFVNDSLGHSHGDLLLIEVAQRLRGCLRTADTGARLGGDEFTVLLEDVAGEAEALAVAARIAGALGVPFLLQGREVVVSASIGVAVSRAYEAPADLLREADLAMYRAKAGGKACSALFDPALEKHASDRLELEGDLRHALARSEFQVHYQPIVTLGDEMVSGVEALLRWNHPQRGLVQPWDFIPLAEETGLIIPIGRWVLEQACMQARQWQVQFPRAHSFTMSVNLSARQLQDPDLAQTIAQIIQRAGLDPGCLELEITESVVMRDAEATDATLRALKAIGIRLAIDDFGTGYSSLSYLKRFPVDTLKIDRSFVDGLGHEGPDTAIVQSVAALGRALDLAVTAEGVETPLQLALLKGMGCEYAQGYLFGKPMPAADLTALIAREPTSEQLRSAA